MEEKEAGLMRKQRCPRCGSKKIRGDIRGWICKVCEFTWDERTRKSRIRKDKVRF